MFFEPEGDVETTEPGTWSRSTIAVGLAGLFFAIALVVFVTQRNGSETADVDAQRVNIEAASAAPAQTLPTATPVPVSPAPEAAATELPVAPTALPLVVAATAVPTATTPPAVPTATPEATEPDPTATATAAETEATADPTATPEAPAPTAPASTATADATATPEATAVPEPTATADASDPTIISSTVTTSEPEPQPTATPVPAAAAPSNLPAPSSGGSFTYVLNAKPSTELVVVYDGMDGIEFAPTYQFLDGDWIYYPLTNPTWYGNTLSLRVLRGAPGDEWAEVVIPTRPNGTTAWVKTSQFDWSSSNFLVRIDVSTNSVSIWEGSELRLETAAVTGTSSSPTPLVSGYVDEKIYGLGGAYGPILLSLGVFSNSLNTFGSGGDVPKIALHGTNRPDLMGQYQSNGCIRVPNDVITQISDMVPIGSLVEIFRS